MWGSHPGARAPGRELSALRAFSVLVVLTGGFATGIGLSALRAWYDSQPRSGGSPVPVAQPPVSRNQNRLGPAGRQQSPLSQSCSRRQVSTRIL
ncbi:hypothetical protein LF1_30200 [Rubripirellula obstinata]|uniref:Uncharacterized protein n=1 Tax=Rubripirellula obstinata TaxID=406547 RepID=A0A5B1CLR6_9BACT|nr:hypothetical protein LF1_30200 [Rubripirellula obstinata]